ncbi:MAG: prolyl oligopeptidase family serine peptidase [Planctomycetaceae bacterium]
MRRLLIASCCLLMVSSVGADERIESALSFVRQTDNLVFRDQVEPHWLDDGSGLWYRVKTGRQSQEFVFVSTPSGERRVAKDFSSLNLPESDGVSTTELSTEIRKSARTGAASSITFVNKLKDEVKFIWINQQGERIPYGTLEAGAEKKMQSYDGHVWLITSIKGETIAVAEVAATPHTVTINGPGKVKEPKDKKPEGAAGRRRGEESPDGKWVVIIEEGVVKLRDRKSQTTTHVPTDYDGVSPFRSGVSWSPDSRAFVVSCADDVSQREVAIVESRPANQTQPALKTLRYTKPGDPLPKPKPVLFHVTDAGGEWVPIATDLFDNPFTESQRVPVQWSPDGREFYFSYNQRGHQVYRVLAVHAETGAIRAIVDEVSPTFIDYANKTWRHWLPDSGELLWMSERDGWCHLWLYDVASGTVKQQVTQGNWPVREVLSVDEEQRVVWFLASGLRKEESPYHLHLCRVNLDGTDFRQLTDSDGTHRVKFSPDRKYFVAEWSRVDHPPVHELRSSEDGRLVSVLETADIRGLLKSGWTLPERFVAKGRDGVHDIHGLIVKPSHFDPSQTYPIVEEVYAGPHAAATPKTFSRLTRQHAIAELGFIVVQSDGMGTNHRGKAFHDVCWKNLKDAGFPDRIAWIRQAAGSRPWMDLSRVGIYGGSAGGQNAMRALLDHHDFYHVAIADCGCHDNRMDKIWWNEQWMGWPVDESYRASSNFEDAHKLQGRLLLIVGELDTNVDPASTAQVVGALQKAQKSFDYMPIMGAGHGAAETPYGSRLRMEYLVRHLLDHPRETR